MVPTQCHPEQSEGSLLPSSCIPYSGIALTYPKAIPHFIRDDTSNEISLINPTNNK
jgi:hypothetical protein